MVLPVRLKQDAIDHVDIDRLACSSPYRFEHRRQAQVATPAKYPIRPTDDQFGGASRKRGVSQSDAREFTMNELSHHVII